MHLLYLLLLDQFRDGMCLKHDSIKIIIIVIFIDTVLENSIIGEAFKI
jgi:hypothetical protein